MFRLNQKGSALLISLFCISLLMYMAAAFLSMSVNNYKMAKFNADSAKALWIAEAGAAQAIHEFKDSYFDHEYELVEKDFGGGKYRRVITTLKGLGIHEALIASLGDYKGRKSALAATLRIATPTDYLFFFDGNGNLLGITGHLKVGGPVHSNGDINMCCYYAAGNTIDILKPQDIAGPAVSSAEIAFRIINTTTPTYYSGPVKIGEGKVKYSGFTNNSDTPQFDFSESSFGIEYKDFVTMAADPPYEFPGGASPNVTFTTSNTPGGLLVDGFHGAFHIDIPTIRDRAGNGYTHYADFLFKSEEKYKAELRRVYKHCIDENWYIKGYYTTDSFGNKHLIIDDSKGLPTGTIINDALAEKYVLGTGLGPLSFPSDYPQEREVIGYGNSSEESFYFFPSTRDVKEVYVGGAKVPADPNEWTVFYDQYYRRGSSGSSPEECRNCKLSFNEELPAGSEVKIFVWHKDGYLHKTYWFNIDNPTKIREGVSGSYISVLRFQRFIPDGVSLNSGSDDFFMGPISCWPITWVSDVQIKEPAGTFESAYYIISDYYKSFNDSHEGQERRLPHQNAFGRIKFRAAPAGEISVNRCRYVYKSDYTKINSMSFDWNPLDWHEYEINGNSLTVRVAGRTTTHYTSGSPLGLWGDYLCIDPFVRMVEVDLSSLSSYPNEGIIFSELPLLVKGSPTERVTIVCLDDVYLQSINEYLPGSTTRAKDDDLRVSPVGIISAGAIWYDFSSPSNRWLNYSAQTPDDDDYLNKYVYQSAGDEQEECVLILNKVALYTTKGIFKYGGRRSQNKFKIIGSVCNLVQGGESRYFGRQEKGYGPTYAWTNQADGYDDSAHLTYNYSLGESVQIYPNSFRGDDPKTSQIEGPPPHMPVDLVVLSWGKLSPSRTQSFIEEITTYIEDKKPIPKEVYGDLLKELRR